jgi:heme/copper-type cytochrome/quinol oxidase subunit 2
MTRSNYIEFISVLVTMAVLFVLALVAVAIFIRQWRRERKDTNKLPRREP